MIVLLYTEGMKQVAFIAVQAVWGFPQTLAGCAVCLAHRERPHFRFHGAVVTTWDNPKGMSLGPFIFLKGPRSVPSGSDVAKTVNAKLLVHEYGHCLQSLILGPLYLPVVGLPSLMWSNMPALSRRRRKKHQSYYALYTERTANWLGEYVLHEPSVGQPLID